MESLEEAAGRIAAAAGSCVLCVDFDGTLAEIVEDPATAVALPQIPELLQRAASSLGRVAVISGRPLAFLEAALAKAPDVSLFGLYGAEARQRDRALANPTIPQDGAARARLDRAIAELEDEAGGIELERKGLSVVVHWRQVPDRADELDALGRAVGERQGLEVLAGKMALELAVPGIGDKGQALRRLAEGMRTACFVGDDRGDLAAFAVLDELADAGLEVIRVAVRSPESPAELVAAADLVVEGPQGTRAFLEAIVAKRG
ncbi:MAG: trehalose-phosphatase [Actinomycetota bacterium]|nr:trehalose-phosphatase [Actinomycetota bacterium]